ncbi:hypothetical protein [Oceanicola sp. S124]|uniref:hypothetical protein n=1 Tax=Oceanicola sp. S124 TaxID=1042378 RepID=UPI000255A42C|nr:hypothetical protein [Oceanicola sp. S124]
MASTSGLKLAALAGLIALLAGCGVDGAPQPPGGAAWPGAGIDRSGAETTGIGVSGETLYGSQAEA